MSRPWLVGSTAQDKMGGWMSQEGGRLAWHSAVRQRRPVWAVRQDAGPWEMAMGWYPSSWARVHPHFGGKEDNLWGTRTKITSEDWSGAGQRGRALAGVGAESSSRVVEGGLRVAQRADGWAGTEEGDEAQTPLPGNPKLQQLAQGLTYSFTINIYVKING